MPGKTNKISLSWAYKAAQAAFFTCFLPLCSWVASEIIEIKTTQASEVVEIADNKEAINHNYDDFNDRLKDVQQNVRDLKVYLMGGKK